MIIPVHNGAEFLKPAVESVLNQTLTQIEVLVMDDGSTDDSVKILQDLAREDDRLIVLERPHRGLIETTNELISLTQSDLIARMDADDICLPNRLELQYAYMSNHPECSVIGGAYELINHLGMKIGVIRPPLNHEEIDATHIRGHCSIHQPTTCVRKSVLEQLGGYNKDFPAAGDLELWLRIAEVGRLANLEDVLLLYRIHDNSISGSKSEKQLELAKKGCELAWQRRGIEGRFEAGSGWRPGKDKSSKLQYALKYGWMAWNNGYKQTAMYYAGKALMLKPTSSEAWKLMVIGSIKRPK